METHACNPSLCEAETGGPQARDQPGLHVEMIYMLSPTEETKMVTYFTIPYHQEKNPNIFKLKF